MNDDAPPSTASATEYLPRVSFAEALRFWTWLGWVSFGGPAGQIAIMHAELVDRRRWISESRFLHALNYCMALPGPEAQQLATYLGWLLHGTWGGIVAGTLFILPGCLVMGVLSWIYVAWGKLAMVSALFAGVKPAVVAIVAAASWRVGRRAVKNAGTALLAAMAFLALLADLPFPLIILAAGLLGLFVARGQAVGHAPAGIEPRSALDQQSIAPPADRAAARQDGVSARRLVRCLVAGLLLWALPIGALAVWRPSGGLHLEMARFFTQAALVTFGGAYAVLPYVYHHAIAAGWLTPEQMIDGLALGETTPGPLILVLAFVGFVGGAQQGGMGWPGAILGGLTATYFTFLPSFLFILIGAPWIERLRGEDRLSAALAGITAAVVGVILHLAVFFARQVFWPADRPWSFGDIHVPSVVLALAALVALSKFRLPIAYVVIASGLAGWGLHLAEAW